MVLGDDTDLIPSINAWMNAINELWLGALPEVIQNYLKDPIFLSNPFVSTVSPYINATNDKFSTVFEFLFTNQKWNFTIKIVNIGTPKVSQTVFKQTLMCAWKFQEGTEMKCYCWC